MRLCCGVGSDWSLSRWPRRRRTFIMITKDIDGNALSGSFITKLQAQSNFPKIRFTYDGSNYDEYVWNIGTIHRDDQLNTGVAVVKVSNADGTWSTEFYDTLANMGGAASVSLYWEGDSEYMPLVTGVVFDVKFRDPDAFIYIKDRFANLLKHPLGSGQVPVDLFSGSAYNSAELVWEILTTHGGLDDTESSANTDIDYDSWTDWNTAMTFFALKARFTGQSIRSALLTIARLSTSMIWIDNTGKFAFAPNFTVGETFTTSTFKKLDIDISMENVINNYDVFHGWDPASLSWNMIPYEGNDAGSEANFGAQTHVIEDRTIWHTTTASATAGSNVFLGKYADPLIIALPDSPFFYHYRTDVGDRITLSQAFKGISTDNFRIQSLDMDMSRGAIKFRGFWV